MKLFSAILSIYILGLIILPCDDVHTENKSGNVSVEIADMHLEHIDSCSPFCTCNCCQTISHPANYHYFSHFTKLIGTSITYIDSSVLSAPIFLWRPPKI
ncbi:DUF6660 family protein [Maribellus maritimus]|uniref:DUF6660 family protein n=1 Tax=Maribellus maritimus TaxID=2870838 RepID=UPI00374D9D23